MLFSNITPRKRFPCLAGGGVSSWQHEVTCPYPRSPSASNAAIKSSALQTGKRCLPSVWKWLTASTQILRSDMVEQINGFSTAGLAALFQAEGLKRFSARGAYNAIEHPISGESFLGVTVYQGISLLTVQLCSLWMYLPFCSPRTVPPPA